MGQQVVSSLSKISYPAWQNEYQAALLEPDRSSLLERVHLAEAAILTRLQEFAENSKGWDHEDEKQAIADAIHALGVLKREKLGFPDWETK
jgi:Tfp pilus assembly protein PilE